LGILLFCMTADLRERLLASKNGRSDIMTDRRVARRRPVLIGGVIVFSEMEPRIQCKVRDISEMGAGIEISADVNLPQEFDLVAEGIRRRCRVVWRRRRRVGVAFRE
jgi:hypothetical protein